MSFGAHVKRAVFPLLCLAMMGYFAYHAVHGDHGLRAWMRMQGEVADLRAELERTRAVRLDLQHHVALLRPEGLDPDMLDERARESLNLTHPNDITILRAAR